MNELLSNSLFQFGISILGIIILTNILINSIVSFILLRRIGYGIISSVIVALFFMIPFLFEFIIKVFVFLRETSADFACSLGGVNSSEFHQKTLDYRIKKFKGE